MISNICKIKKGTGDLEAIFREAQKVAVYNELTNKQTMQLRLLCEEIDGMLPNIISNFEGYLWIDFEDNVCKVNVSIQIPELHTDKKEELIKISKSKKNAAAVGIVGKIRNAIENFFLDGDTMLALDASADAFYLSTECSESADYSCVWSLSRYKSSVQGYNSSEEWDELEKSVIASVADDITIGVKGKKADIVVVKKFA